LSEQDLKLLLSRNVALVLVDQLERKHVTVIDRVCPDIFNKNRCDFVFQRITWLFTRFEILCMVRCGIF